PAATPQARADEPLELPARARARARRGAADVVLGGTGSRCRSSLRLGVLRDGLGVLLGLEGRGRTGADAHTRLLVGRVDGLVLAGSGALAHARHAPPRRRPARAQRPRAYPCRVEVPRARVPARRVRAMHDAARDRDVDVLVVGSGFGGSVAALRLTEKGYRVAVLEAGRRFADDDFARTSWDLRRFLWAPRL